MTQPKNPFKNSGDWFSELVKLDNHVMSTGKRQFKQFIKNNGTQNQYSWSIRSIIYSFGQHLILASIISILLIGLATGTVAQAFAPESFKPTTVYQNFVKKFQSNKQTERNPFTSLQPDSDNNVFKYDNCGLSVKYPKKIGDHQIDPLRDKNIGREGLIDNVVLTDTKDYLDSINRYTQEEGVDPLEKEVQGTKASIQAAQAEKNPYKSLSISCFSAGSRTALYDVGQNGEYLTKEQLREKVGWFINEGDIKNIRSNKILSGIELSFEYGDKAYNIIFTDPDYQFDTSISPEKQYFENGFKKYEGIYGNQVQIQFNDLVESQTNSEIKTDSRIDQKGIAEIPKNPYNWPITNDANFDITAENPGKENVTAQNLQFTYCANPVSNADLGLSYLISGTNMKCIAHFSQSLPTGQLRTIKIALRSVENLTLMKSFECKFLLDNVHAHDSYDGTQYNTLDCINQKLDVPNGKYELLISFDSGENFVDIYNQPTSQNSSQSAKKQYIEIVPNRFSADKKTYMDLESVSCEKSVKVGQLIHCAITLKKDLTDLETQEISLNLRRETSIQNRPVILPFSCLAKLSAPLTTSLECDAQPESGITGTFNVDFVSFGQSLDNVAQVIVEP
jgi:hypothetical protein